jgi:ribosomal subunit interface protein
MLVKISGNHFDIGQALQVHVEKDITDGVSKYIKSAISAEVKFTKENHLIITNILIHEGIDPNVIIRSEGEGTDAYSSFADSLEKSLKQLRRYKRKLVNHKKQNRLSIKDLQGNTAA